MAYSWLHRIAKPLDKYATYVNVNHILTLHIRISQVATGKSHFPSYYPWRITHNSEVITTTNILLVTIIALVCM